MTKGESLEVNTTDYGSVAKYNNNDSNDTNNSNKDNVNNDNNNDDNNCNSLKDHDVEHNKDKSPSNNKKPNNNDNKKLKNDELAFRMPNDNPDIVSHSIDTENESLASVFKASKGDGEVKVVKEGPVTWRTGYIDFKTLWCYTGPGWLMSLAYLDPGNLESDAQNGAYTRYSLLWVLFWCTTLGLVLQNLASKIGIVTGRSLAQACKEGYSRPIAIILYIMTEVAIIGSDIQEVLGSAIAFQLLFGIPLWSGCLITGLDTFLFLALHYKGVRLLECVICILIFTMAVCFWVNMIIADPDAIDIVKGTVIPTLPSYALNNAVGTLGAVIMPHNLYLHSALVKSRNFKRSDEVSVNTAYKYNKIESSVSLFISFLINLAVVCCFAVGLYDNRCASHTDGPYAVIPYTEDGCDALLSDGTCCGAVGLGNAGIAMEAFLGKSAKYIWAVGLLAAGQASTLTGTLSGQYVMEGFWNLKIKIWIRMAITRTIALGPAITVACLASSSLGTVDAVNQWLNILQAIQLPFALFPVLHFAFSKKFMKLQSENEYETKSYQSSKKIIALIYFIAFVVVGVNLSSIVLTLLDVDTDTSHKAYFYLPISVLFTGYVSLIITILVPDMKRGLRFIKDMIASKKSLKTVTIEFPEEYCA